MYEQATHPGMAGNLFKAGHELTAYNRMPSKASPSPTGRACRHRLWRRSRLQDAGDDRAVDGDKDILACLPKGTLHISSSTISVALAERLIADNQVGPSSAGERFLAVPVFGRPNVAAAGNLFVIAAGLPDAIRLAPSSLRVRELGGHTQWFRYGIWQSESPSRLPYPL